MFDIYFFLFIYNKNTFHAYRLPVDRRGVLHTPPPLPRPTAPPPPPPARRGQTGACENILKKVWDRKNFRRQFDLLIPFLIIIRSTKEKNYMTQFAH